MSRCNLNAWLSTHKLVLMEGAVNERLRRAPGIHLHPLLGNAALVHEPSGRKALSVIYQEYIDISGAADLPLMLFTPTWRADRERVGDAGIDPAINQDAARFLRALREQQTRPELIAIGGLLGPRNDCYLPEEGLSVERAREYHAWQADELVRGGVDYLVAQTLPNVDEALGMAQAMARTGAPYIPSFVINRHGRVLDGNRLLDAVHRIDAYTRPRPLGYMVNCAYPAFLCPQDQPATLFERLIGYQANASSLDHGELEGSACLRSDPVDEWTGLMLELNHRYGMRMLGGCCGTSGEYLQRLADGV